jgi:glutamine---fructose-6-phosphate transaminase (isomerizing)
MTLMRREMDEQPAILRALVAGHERDVSAVRALLPEPPGAVVLLARGSSDNAATLGRYAIELASGRPAALAAPSLLTRYRAVVDYRGVLVVALSQSGDTPEIVTAARAMRKAGGRVIAITNGEESDLAAEADLTLALHAGRELAVPATKTVTAQMLRVIQVAAAFGSLGLDDDELAALPGAVAAVLDDDASGRALAGRWQSATGLLGVARGALIAAAQETMLKIRETSGVTATGGSSADLLHGPIASIGPGDPVLLFSGDPATDADLDELAERLRARGADTAICGTDPAAELRRPATSTWLAPIVATVCGQQLALALAEARGADPDAPAGLTKVTPTE